MQHSGGARILLVEDMPVVRLTMSVLLGRQGYVVTAVGSGEDAVQRMAHERFDMLVLDVHLPGMSGLDVARHAATLAPGASVMFLTGSAYVESGGAAPARLDGHVCLPKTASPQEVLAAVAASLAAVRPAG